MLNKMIISDSGTVSALHRPLTDGVAHDVNIYQLRHVIAFSRDVIFDDTTAYSDEKMASSDGRNMTSHSFSSAEETCDGDKENNCCGGSDYTYTDWTQMASVRWSFVALYTFIITLSLIGM